MPIDRFLFDLLGVSRIDGDYQVAVGTDQADDINRTSPYSWYYEGRGGGDTLTGDRYDTVGYASSPEAVRVDLSSVGPDGYLDIVAGGDAWGDRVSAAFSRVVGSEFGDLLTGDGRDNVLAGLGGDDGLVGGRGDDTLVGGLGADSLDGGTGDDRLLGGIGDDILRAGIGNDRLEGGLDNERRRGQ